MFVLLSGFANAQGLSAIDSSKTLINVSGVKSGIIYDFRTNQALAVNTIRVISIGLVDINAGAMRTDGIAATASIDNIEEYNYKICCGNTIKKLCNKCGKLKKSTEFCMRIASKDGLTSVCKACIKVMNKKYKEIHKTTSYSKKPKIPKEELKTPLKYYYENREKILAKRRLKYGKEKMIETPKNNKTS